MTYAYDRKELAGGNLTRLSMNMMQMVKPAEVW